MNTKYQSKHNHLLYNYIIHGCVLTDILCSYILDKHIGMKNILKICNKPTRCNSGSIVFINNYRYALHVSEALCVHHQDNYKL